MTHGALFNGIAGFPLAAQWAGIETAWTVEIEEFCNKVSKKHFPYATQYTDIHDCHNLPYVDIISGGFPCQPFSVAGKQLGNEDDRALWPQMLRIIREVKPAYVIGENVTGIINMALDQVLASLEDEGYTTETFIVPACAINAPHRRDRVWIVAYSDSRATRSPREGGGIDRGGSRNNDEQEEWGEQAKFSIRRSNVLSNEGVNANPNHQRCKERQPTNKPEGEGRDCRLDTERGVTTDTTSQQDNRLRPAGLYTLASRNGFRLTEPPVCGSYDGFPSWLDGNINSIIQHYGSTIERNRNEILSEVWGCISEEKVWKQVRGLYQISKPDVLLQILQLFKAIAHRPDGLPSESQKVTGGRMQNLPDQFPTGSSSLGQGYNQQHAGEHRNPLPFLPHEIALAGEEIERWHRGETRNRTKQLKAYGNAIVPQIAFELFKAIATIEDQRLQQDLLAKQP